MTILMGLEEWVFELTLPINSNINSHLRLFTDTPVISEKGPTWCAAFGDLGSKSCHISGGSYHC